MRYAPIVISTEAFAAVTLADAKAFCDVQHSDDDASIAGFIDAAVEFLQPPRGCLRVSIVEQTLRQNFGVFPCGPIRLHGGPVTAISSVKYFDSANVDQTLSSSLYFLDDEQLVWAETFSAPATYTRPSAVRIEYVAGFAAAALPKTIRLAMLQMVRHWYDNRDAVQAVGPLNMMPLGIDDLIANWRVR